MNTRNTKRTETPKNREYTDQEVKDYITKKLENNIKGGTCKLCKLTYKCYFKAHLNGLVHQNWIDERENKKDISNGEKSSNKKRSSDESSSSHDDSDDSDDSDDPDYLPKGTKKPTNKKPEGKGKRIEDEIKNKDI